MKEVKQLMILRVYLVYFGILLFGLAIFGKAAYIQYVEGASLKAKALSQELEWVEVEAIRGNICADDGTFLASSIPIFEIRMDVCTDSITDLIFNRNVDSLSFMLASLFKDRSSATYREELVNARKKGDRYLLIKRNVKYPEMKKLSGFPIFRRGKFKGGLIVIPHYRRETPFKELAKRTIGFANSDTTKKSYQVGIEGKFTGNLQGTPGGRLMRRTGSGSRMVVDFENQVEPVNGDDIITTIDINIQDLAESALLDQLITDSAEHGCVVVMEVSTGQIKAIANLGRTPEGNYAELFNYAIGEPIEPGSTFKLATFIVALEDGVIDLSTPVATGNGVIKYRSMTFKDSHTGGYGTITAEEVFEHSSNVGTSKIIMGAYADRPQKFIDGLYRLSIHQKLGLQINGEAPPDIKNTDDPFWSYYSLPSMSIGYEVRMTPLQLLTLYNAVANDGVMVKPLLVKEIRRGGQVIKSFETDVINNSVCSPETAAKMKQMLTGVVEEGTATTIKNTEYKICGKTGTAQIADSNRGYGKEKNKVRYRASFVGFFPAEKPVYSCVVVIHEPRKGRYYGATVAAPVFREISDRLYAVETGLAASSAAAPDSLPQPYSHAGFAGDYEQVLRGMGIYARQPEITSEWVGMKHDRGMITLSAVPVTKGIMPDLTGMGLKDVIYLMEKQGIQIVARGKGNVVSQSVIPGMPIGKGSVVSVELATDKKTEPQPDEKNQGTAP
jgi:cell division protein FtsI (penicillin-binding protein 3)